MVRCFSTVEVKLGGTLTLRKPLPWITSLTATIDEDFSTEATSLTFDKDGTKIITLKNFNDGVAEDTESIVIKFVVLLTRRKIEQLATSL
jgi:hypothetical protein